MRIGTLEVEGECCLRVGQLGRPRHRDGGEVGRVTALERPAQLAIGLRIDLTEGVVGQALGVAGNPGRIGVLVTITPRRRKWAAQLVDRPARADPQRLRAGPDPTVPDPAGCGPPDAPACAAAALGVAPPIEAAVNVAAVNPPVIAKNRRRPSDATSSWCRCSPWFASCSGNC